MHLLVLGGGGFLGFHVVDQAVAAGHDVTVLGRSGKPPLSGVEALVGDRTDPDGLAALRGRSFDAVLDTFTDPEPGAPAIARSAAALQDAVGCYGYVSGMSVYAPSGPAVPDESGPVRQAGVEPDDDPLQARSLAKLAAERVLHETFRGPVLLPRVGIMVGPRDPSHRFTWWPLRFHRALAGTAPRTVVAPGDPERAVQYSDARDVAAWTVRMLAHGQGGTYNVVGPDRPESLAAVLGECLVAAGAQPGDIELDWRSEDDLRTALDGVEEEQRPLWFPEDQIPQAAIDSSKAIGQGLTLRATVETARDTLRWALEQDGPVGLVGGPFEQRFP